MALAVVVAGILVRIQRDRITRYLNIGMICIVSWNLLALSV